MLRLDHCVIHIDPNPAALAAFKQQAVQHGFPFDPTRGKGTGGFRTADLFIGEQYWELVWLKRPDGGGWRPEWVARYNAGQRGIVCLMLLTDHLDRMREDWLNAGLHPSEPERISYSLLGLVRKTLPWRNLYLEPIPGTDLQIGVQEMDSTKAARQMQLYMQPNASANGIRGFRRAIIRQVFSAEAWSFLGAAFPQADRDDHRIRAALDEDMELRFERITDTHQALQVIVQAVATNEVYVGGLLAIENVSMQTIGQG
jgi:hypothetical protein